MVETTRAKAAAEGENGELEDAEETLLFLFEFEQVKDAEQECEVGVTPRPSGRRIGAQAGPIEFRVQAKSRK